MKTDAEVKRDVTNELSWEPSVQARRIGIEVCDGVVTLTGEVASQAEKLAAETAAQRVGGVRAVTLELKVDLPGHTQRGDMELARTARRTLEWMSNISDDTIRVTVEGGWITLSGEVDWDYQRRAATAAVQALMGVRGVIDTMTLKQNVASTSVIEAIASALARAARVDTRRIHVAIDGNQVTLSGQVANWSERELAQHAAWNAPGVSTVIDDLTVLA